MTTIEEALRKELATLREQHSNVLRENECQRQELAASRKWNQDLLDAARETRPDDDRRAAEWGLAVFAAFKKLETEFEAANAHIAELEERNRDCRDAATRIIGEMTTRLAEATAALARTEAEAQVCMAGTQAALEAAKAGIAHMAAVLVDAEELLGVEETGELITGPHGPISRLIARAARAEAECKTMREALKFALDFKITDSSNQEVAEDSLHEIRKIARAALNPSPAGREG